MSFRISLVREQHGDTIRLEKDISSLEIPNPLRDEQKYVEKVETIGCLGIIDDHKTAVEVVDVLNLFIDTCVKNGLLNKEAFRYMPTKEVEQR